MFFKTEKHRSIYTNRLKLRAPTFLDVDDVFKFCSDPASSRYADWTPHTTKGETREYIGWLRKKSGEKAYTWMIEHRDDARVIGTISITDTDYSGKIFTIGYTLAAEYQHKGFAYEAVKALMDYLFGELFAERIQAKVMPENEPSIRLLERVGMSREGLLKNGAFLRTHCVDVYLYAIAKK